MDKVIDKGDVQVVTTKTHFEEGLAHLNVFIHHTLTPDQRDLLVGLVERIAVKAVEAWVSL